MQGPMGPRGAPASRSHIDANYRREGIMGTKLTERLGYVQMLYSPKLELHAARWVLLPLCATRNNATNTERRE